MKRASFVVVVSLLSLICASAALAGGLTLVTASGTVSKVEKDSLTVRPRGGDGKFGKSLVLKLTGTSKITSLSQQKRAGKLVYVQREIEAKDIEANQHIAVVYTMGTKNAVLLSAVVVPAAAK